ncbi:MAG: ABC transporter permease [Actinomycetota bacterium]|nr:ABC transporter permease [Actinomycetota bacterium]
MLRLIRSELLGRRERSLALLAGIVLACASFVVLSATARTEQLGVHGTIAKTFRSSYDILVRPHGTETQLERAQGLVRENYLSGIFGGITMAQYRQVAHLPGVQVAAPIAMIGYVLQPVEFNIDLTSKLSSAPRQLFAVSVTRATDRGLVHLPDQSGYMYVTSRPIAPLTQITGASPFIGATESLSHGRSALVCPTRSTPFASPNPFRFAERGIAACWSRRTGLQGFGWSYPAFGRERFGVTIDWNFPFLLAAIDPAAEAKLVGVNRTVVSGRYLEANDAPAVKESGRGPQIDVPVLISTHPYADDQDQITVSRLSAAAAQALVHAPLSRVAAGRIPGAGEGTVILKRSYTTGQAYQRLLGTISHQQLGVIQNYWSSGPTQYRQLGHVLVPTTTHVPLSAWRSNYEFTGAVDAPIDAQTTSYRPLNPHVGLAHGQYTIHLPTLRAVGKFDPTKLPGFDPLTRLPLETYNPPVAAPADARTRRLLSGQNLLPDANPAGYLQAPPLLLTTLSSIPAFTDRSVFPNGNDSAPISVIRVRVAGVRGADALSRERVRLVAQRIAQATGLQVDITIGSSPTPMRINLPATSQRPALELSEGWVKKGVSVSILNGVDRQSEILFGLILIVAVLFLTNAANASVRARRTELGILAAVGWTRPSLFAVIIGELATIGLVGGVIGALLALAISAALGDHLALTTAAVAVPAALAISATAGLIPALRACRLQPVAAVRPPVLEAARAWHARSLTQLSLINLLRAPGRSLLGALSLAIGVFALTVLVGATLAFKNLLIGTLLGSAVSLQVSSSDYAAVAIIIILAVAAVADVLFLNQRERASELATLTATGWTKRSLNRLVTTEGAWIAILGSLLGGGLGLAATASLSHALPPTLLLTTAGAIAAGALAGTLAALAPSLWLARIPIASLLTSE